MNTKGTMRFITLWLIVALSSASIYDTANLSSASQYLCSANFDYG